MGVVAAAEAVIRLAEANMINALKLVTIQRGHDPRDLTMVASGGGGPMHAATLARELGVKRIVVPRYAGLFSAWGMLAARPRLDLSQTRFSQAERATRSSLRAPFSPNWKRRRRDISARARDAMIFDRKSRCAMPARNIQWRRPTIRLCGGIDELLEAFHIAHEKAYTFRLPDTGVELVTFQLGAELDTPRVGLPEIAADSTVAEALDRATASSMSAKRRACGCADVYDRDLLPAGATLPGPALIEEPTATTLVLPGQTRSDRPLRAPLDRGGRLKTNAATAITLDRVSKVYDAPVVSDVSLEIAGGSFVTLLGPSGSGKSTILQMIGGFVPPTSGRILFGGEDVTDAAAEQTALQHDLPGPRPLSPHDGGGERRLWPQVRGVDAVTPRKRVPTCSRLSRSTATKRRRVHQLSGGQRQRVALARALVLEPAVLLLDEPLTGLDEQLRQQLRDEIGRLHRRLGSTFLAVTHNQEEALSLSDRIARAARRQDRAGRLAARTVRTPANAFVARFVGVDAMIRPESVEPGATKLDAR